MNKLQLRFIKDAVAHKHLLKQWERDFIDDMSKLPDHVDLSDKQNHCLNKISTSVNSQRK